MIVFVVLRRIYSGRFGLAANAIRDDEEKAEGMGIHTMRYKTVGWAVAAFFLGISGALFGNMIGFIEPLEVAFPTVTFGIFMVIMCLLGGKGTLWGPVVGATLFHAFKEVTWTYMLGWQWGGPGRPDHCPGRLLPAGDHGLGAGEMAREVRDHRR